MKNTLRRKPARTVNRLTGWIFIAIAIAIAVVTGLTLLSVDVSRGEPQATASIAGQPTEAAEEEHEHPDTEVPGMPAGDLDGFIPDGVLVSVFDNETPAVVNLNPELLAAVRQAATDAAGDSVEFYVTSGWRSARYQEQLLREAIFTYGSEEEAARWVATADTSAHVTGDAVDVGPLDAMLWLSEYGSGYGLCQIYDNEPWHYELRPNAIHSGCPPMYADPTFDPRMWQ